MERYFVKRIDVSRESGTALISYNGRQDYMTTSPEKISCYILADYGFKNAASAKRSNHYRNWMTRDKSYYDTKEINLCKAILNKDWSVTIVEED